MVSVVIGLTIDLDNFGLGPMKVLKADLGTLGFASMKVLIVGLVLTVVVSKLIGLTLACYLAGIDGFEGLVSTLSGSMSSMSLSFNNVSNSSRFIP